MNLLLSRWSTVCAAVALGCLFVIPAPARAQMFVELGAGLNFVSPVPSGVSYGSGSNLQASIGWKIEPKIRLRVDVLTSQFDVKATVTPPCPSFGCSGPGFSFHSESVNGVTANILADVDARGILYLIGGAGLYDVHTQSTERLIGVSAGAGIAVPMGSRLRGVVEARWHGLLGATSGPAWLVPITVGLRY
jgi:hypothetical protein